MARNDRLGHGVIRCAVYTRKSTEEGLDQAFNSLDAQREACVAYIASQRHEGWILVDEHYDDGGFSGGSMARPALQDLLKAVDAGEVDVIVVYKVDRLTRSLADFAKIVEILDKQGASFVSVTQSFNTTSSMGRLTLNVLLSFAQFEREVTGERIRDKIAASKAKGMWMGGPVPCGYRVEDRKLVVVDEDAELVRMIFRRYLELGSVTLLAAELENKGIRTPERKSQKGNAQGGAVFSRGILYHMLRNRLYIGEVTHKGERHKGQHEPIIKRAVFEAAGQLLDGNAHERRMGTSIEHPALLTGLLWTEDGRRLTPTHSNKKGLRYYYYATMAKADTAAQSVSKSKLRAMRIPAGDIEGVVTAQLKAHLQNLTLEDGHEHCHSIQLDREIVLQHIAGVTVYHDAVEIVFNSSSNSSSQTVTIPAQLIRSGKGKTLAIAPDHGQVVQANPDPSLIKLIVKAHCAREALEASGGAPLSDIASNLGYSRDYTLTLLRIAYLAPDITAAILAGKQPATLNRTRLARISSLPIDWHSQRQMLSFG
jgi:site-specific DNA recombinase